MRSPAMHAVVIDSALAGAWRVATVALLAAVPAVLARWALLSTEAAPLLADVLPALAGAGVAVFAARRLPTVARRLTLSALGATLVDEDGHDRPVRPRVVLDLGPWMLVRADGHEGCKARPVWLPLAAASDVAGWPAARAALALAAAAPERPAR